MCEISNHKKSYNNIISISSSTVNKKKGKGGEERGGEGKAGKRNSKFLFGKEAIQS